MNNVMKKIVDGVRDFNEAWDGKNQPATKRLFLAFGESNDGSDDKELDRMGDRLLPRANGMLKYTDEHGFNDDIEFSVSGGTFGPGYCLRLNASSKEIPCQFDDFDWVTSFVEFNNTNGGKLLLKQAPSGEICITGAKSCIRGTGRIDPESLWHAIRDVIITANSARMIGLCD